MYTNRQKVLPLARAIHRREIADEKRRLDILAKERRAAAYTARDKAATARLVEMLRRAALALGIDPEDFNTVTSLRVPRAHVRRASP